MSTGIKYNITLGKAMKEYGTAFEKSLDFLGESGFMTSIAKGYRYYINRFVPKQSGNLRKAAMVLGTNLGAHGSDGMGVVYWKSTKAVEPYLHYQYEGEVYGPNKPVFNALGPNAGGPGAGVHSGWVSPTKPKTPQGRKLGKPYTYTLHDGRVVHIKGYTTPNTTHHWIDEFMKDTGDYGEKAVAVLAGRYTYDWFCKASKGTKYEIRHYGGYQAFNRWRQIQDIRD